MFWTISHAFSSTRYSVCHSNAPCDVHHLVPILYFDADWCLQSDVVLDARRLQATTRHLKGGQKHGKRAFRHAVRDAKKTCRYNDFDIFSDRFSRPFQLDVTPTRAS